MEGRFPAFYNEYTLDEQNRLLNIVVDFFGEEWLAGNSNNSVVRLWNRKDQRATWELLSLATALELIKPIDEKWLDGQIKQAKSHNLSESRGALFEILGFSYMVSEESSLKFARKNNPGIDGYINFRNEPTINVSMKSFGLSYHELSFREGMKKIETKLCSLIKRNNLLTLSCVIDFKNYPEKKNFDEIITHLEHKIPLFAKNFQPCYSQNENTVVSLNFIKGYSPATGFNSYQLRGFSPLHKNEFKNLTDYLDKACANFNKHTNMTMDELNFLYIHLHESSAIKKCQEHLETYFTENANSPIGYILLHKAQIGWDISSVASGSRLNHTFMVTANPQRSSSESESKRKLPSFKVLFGNISHEDCPLILQVDGKNHHLNNVYWYQSGEIVEEATWSQHIQSSELLHFGPGLRRSSVLTIEGKKVFIRGKFPDDDRLEIL